MNASTIGAVMSGRRIVIDLVQKVRSGSSKPPAAGRAGRRALADGCATTLGGVAGSGGGGDSAKRSLRRGAIRCVMNASRDAPAGGALMGCDRHTVGDVRYEA